MHPWKRSVDPAPLKNWSLGQYNFAPPCAMLSLEDFPMTRTASPACPERCCRTVGRRFASLLLALIHLRNSGLVWVAPASRLKHRASRTYSQLRKNRNHGNSFKTNEGDQS